MSISSVTNSLRSFSAAQTAAAAQAPEAAAPQGLTAAKDDPRLRQAFDSFVGQTFYGQMLKAMRKTVGKPSYFYGGHTEEIFRQKLDEVMADKLSQANARQFSGPMYELFSLQRR